VEGRKLIDEDIVEYVIEIIENGWKNESMRVDCVVSTPYHIIEINRKWIVPQDI
jgi:hypothetical protein